MYYLNAFNEMLRKRRQQNNMMNGEGYQGVGNAPPSGPMGARQSGNGMSGVRNFLNDPFVNIFAAVTPFRAPFAAAKLGVSAYDRLQANQNPYADDSMDRLSFNAPAYGQTGPEYGPAPTGTIDPGAYEGGFYGPQAFNENARNMGGGPGAPNFDANAAFVEASRAAYNAAPIGIVGGPVARSSITGESLAPMAPVAFSSPVARSSITGESLPSMAGDFGIRSGGAGGEFGGGVGTGNFGGSPADAADLGYAHGGMVDARHLKGRAPAPDDGYGALQGGEYVITKAAVEKYGKRLLDAINNGTFR